MINVDEQGSRKVEKSWKEEGIEKEGVERGTGGGKGGREKEKEREREWGEDGHLRVNFLS